MFGQKGNKGYKKEYNHFLKDEIDDYYFEDDQPDSIQEYKKKLMKIEQSDSSNKPPSTLQRTSKRPYQGFKYQSKVDLLPAFKNISEETVITLASYLDIKCLNALFLICKSFKELFDTAGVWKCLIYRDNPHLQASSGGLAVIEIRQLYRYLFIGKFRPMEATFNSQVLSKNPKSITEELESNSIDILTSKTPVLNAIVNNCISRTHKGVWTQDIRLSWLNNKGGVGLWLAGFEKGNVGSKAIGLSKMLGAYSFFGKGRNAYFLNQKYLVIEVAVKEQGNLTGKNEVDNFEDNIEENKSNENDEREEGVRETFIIIDLEKYLDDSKVISKEGHQQSTYRFTFKKTASLEVNKEKVKVQSFDFNECIELEIPKDELKQAEIKVKASNNGTFLFYTKGIKNPVMVYWNFESQNTLETISLKLSSPLEEIFISKKTQGDSVFPFYIAQQGLGFSAVKKDLEKILSLNTIFLINQNYQQQTENTSSNRSALVHRKFYHGIHTWKTTIQEEEIEFIVCYKYTDQSLFFINLDKFEKYDYLIKDVKDDRCDWGWDIYKNKLYLFADYKVHIYNFSLLNKFHIEKICSETVLSSRFIINTKSWNFTTPCYNVSVKAFPLIDEPYSEIEVTLYSTQSFGTNFFVRVVLSYGSYRDERIGNYQIKFNNFLDEMDYEDRAYEITNKLDISFKEHTLLIKTSKKMFFVDIEKFIGKHDRPKGNKVPNPNSFETSMNVLKTLKEKKEEEKKIKHIVEIHENPNVNKGNLKKNNWKQSHKKILDDESQEEREIRRKGEKYFKNLRQNKHLEKLN